MSETTDILYCEYCEHPIDDPDGPFEDYDSGKLFCCEDCCSEYFDNADFSDRVDYDDEYSDRLIFADPGGKSALRAADENNPRNLPCPNCGEPDRLTPADRALGYQCDTCADQAERGY